MLVLTIGASMRWKWMSPVAKRRLCKSRQFGFSPSFSFLKIVLFNFPQLTEAHTRLEIAPNSPSHSLETPRLHRHIASIFGLSLQDGVVSTRENAPFLCCSLQLQSPIESPLAFAHFLQLTSNTTKARSAFPIYARSSNLQNSTGASPILFVIKRPTAAVIVKLCH